MRVIQTLFAVICVALAGCAANLPAATAPASACADDGYRQLDFWVGEWDLSWQGQDGATQTGSNRISGDELGDCVISEHFDGAPSITLRGQSVSVYDPRSDTWRQTWVDNQGGYIALSGGLGDDGLFALETVSGNDDRPTFRMIWQDVSDDAMRWHWQQKNMQSGAWEDRWVIDYTRRR